MTSVISARRVLRLRLENVLQPLLDVGWQPDGNIIQDRGVADHPSVLQLMRRGDQTVEIEYTSGGGLTVHHHPLANRSEPRLGLVYDLRRYIVSAAYQAEGLLR